MRGSGQGAAKLGKVYRAVPGGVKNFFRWCLDSGGPVPHSWSERRCACADSQDAARQREGVFPTSPGSSRAQEGRTAAGAESTVRLSPQKKHLKQTCATRARRVPSEEFHA